MSVRHAIYTALAALHLTLASFGAAQLQVVEPDNDAGYALGVARHYTGSDASFGFFAPGVGPQMTEAAGTDRPIRHAARFRFRRGDDIAKRFVRLIRMRDERHAALADEHDRRQIAQRVERQIGNQRRIDRVRVEDNGKSVTVGIRFCDGRSTDRSGRAAPVLDDDLLAGLLRQLLRQNASDLIDRTPGRKDRDQFDGFRRPGLRVGGQR